MPAILLLLAILMAELTPELRTLRARGAAHQSWGNTTDRTARTAKPRQALEAKFLAEAGGDPKRAESLRRAFYARLAFKSAQARRRRAGAPPGDTPPAEPGGTTSPTNRKAVIDARIAELDGGDDHA